MKSSLALASLVVSLYGVDAQLAEISCASQKCVGKTSPPYIQLVDPNSKYATKCCSFTQFAGSVPADSGCGNLFVSAYQADGETCMHHATLTFDQATKVCADQGARMCTSTENLLDCTRPAKCGLNAKKIWSQGDNMPSAAPSALDTEMPSVAVSASPSLGKTSAPSVAVSASPSLGKTSAPSAATPAPTAATPAPTVPVTSAPTPETDPCTACGHDDPHLYTWKGIRYGYHGQCDLIFTTCPNFDNGKGLHVHLRTKFVEPLNWSTISGMAVKIGEDVLEVENNGEYYLNGELNADLTGSSLEGHMVKVETPPVVKHTVSSIYTIELEDNMSIEITRSNYYDRRDMIHFKFNGVHDHRKNGGMSLSDCEGLTSTWDHPEGGELLVGRSGTKYTPQESVDFGPEWQVDLTKGDPMLFAKDIGQQLPQGKCIDSPLQTDQRHLNRLLTENEGENARIAEEACSHLKDNADLFDACFFDVLVTGDVTFAQEAWYNF